MFSNRLDIRLTSNCLCLICLLGREASRREHAHAYTHTRARACAPADENRRVITCQNASKIGVGPDNMTGCSKPSSATTQKLMLLVSSTRSG